MHWIYNVGFLLFGIFYLPRFLQKSKQAKDRGRLLRERLGLLPKNLLLDFQGRRPVWIHCVSVGEVLAVEKFIISLLERWPECRLVLTTVTPTGQEIARKWAGERLKVFYFPFDLRFSVGRFFDALNPALLLLVETEIWPNVIREASERAVPIGIVNGRISERSFKAFRQFSLIFKSLLGSIDFFLVQTEGDKGRLIDLGVSPERVTVTGNMKLDVLDLNGEWKEDRIQLREKWGFSPSDAVLIGGSTHPGEEEILLRVFARLRSAHPRLKLLLAPRHVERSTQILEQAAKPGLRVLLASAASGVSSPDILILDRLGELRRLYAIADAVFVGGSLVRHGGQNPVEPAASSRAIVHGPWVFNFQDLYQRLDKGGGSLRVGGEEELALALERIFSNDREREQLGTKAYQVIQELRGATERNLIWMGGRYEFA